MFMGVSARLASPPTNQQKPKSRFWTDWLSPMPAGYCHEYRTSFLYCWPGIAIGDPHGERPSPLEDLRAIRGFGAIQSELFVQRESLCYFRAHRKCFWDHRADHFQQLFLRPDNCFVRLGRSRNFTLICQAEEQSFIGIGWQSDTPLY